MGHLGTCHIILKLFGARDNFVAILAIEIPNFKMDSVFVRSSSGWLRVIDTTCTYQKEMSSKGEVAEREQSKSEFDFKLDRVIVSVRLVNRQ